MQLTRLIIILLLFLCNAIAITINSHDGACKAHTDEGVIDLSPIANDDGTAKFTDVPDPVGGPYPTSYEFNPCYDFSDSKSENACMDVSICEITQYGPDTAYTGLGSAKGAVWQVSKSGNVTLMYNKQSTYSIAKVVLLRRDSSTSNGLTAEHDYDDPDNSIVTLVLTSKYCCPQKARTPTKNPVIPGGLSLGSVLCIVLLVVICLYLIGGFVYTIGYKEAAGRERIPNSGFWLQLPGFVADGARFAFCCGSSRTAGGKSGTEKYDQI